MHVTIASGIQQHIARPIIRLVEVEEEVDSDGVNLGIVRVVVESGAELIPDSSSGRLLLAIGAVVDLVQVVGEGGGWKTVSTLISE